MFAVGVVCKLKCSVLYSELQRLSLKLIILKIKMTLSIYPSITELLKSDKDLLTKFEEQAWNSLVW